MDTRKEAFFILKLKFYFLMKKLKFKNGTRRPYESLLIVVYFLLKF